MGTNTLALFNKHIKKMFNAEILTDNIYSSKGKLLIDFEDLDELISNMIALSAFMVASERKLTREQYNQFRQGIVDLFKGLANNEEKEI